MNTKPKSKKVPAYIQKEMRKFHLEHARRIKDSKNERLGRILGKGKFETVLDVVEFELGLSSEQLKRLGSLYLLRLATGIQGTMTPQEVLEMAKPPKKVKRPPSSIISVVSVANSVDKSPNPPVDSV